MARRLTASDPIEKVSLWRSIVTQGKSDCAVTIDAKDSHHGSHSPN
jgi:hypothetical protein